MSEYRIETLAIHGGQAPDPTTGAVMPPIYQTSTFAQTDVGVGKGFVYSRVDNPTRAALERNLALLEGGAHALAFASGMAAIDAAMRLLRQGDHLIVCDDVYGRAFSLIQSLVVRAGVEVSFVDLTRLDDVKAAFRSSTKMIWVETPTNPQLKIADLAALAEMCRAHGAWMGVDNTFATPCLQNPLALGAALVVHSTTKYLGGHSDVIGGAVVTNDAALHDELRFLQKTAGAVPGPHDCWLVLRGTKTLPLRMERHCANAMRLAEWLSGHKAIARTIYPGLGDHPQHELARRQMRGFGGMISIVMRGGHDAARRLVKRTKLFTLAVSLGGVESLIEVPAGMTHALKADSDLAVDPALVRLSVGIEHVDDLKEDLNDAMLGL